MDAHKHTEILELFAVPHVDSYIHQQNNVRKRCVYACVSGLKAVKAKPSLNRAAALKSQPSCPFLLFTLY